MYYVGEIRLLNLYVKDQTENCWRLKVIANWIIFLPTTLVVTKTDESAFSYKLLRGSQHP